MLSGDAQDFYFENLVERNLGFQTMAELIKEQFETDERKNDYLAY